MRVRNEGGQAFPTSGEGLGREFASPGMTLRDYFAALVMPAFISREPLHDHAEEFARLAYQVADAMLKERAVEKERERCAAIATAALPKQPMTFKEEGPAPKRTPVAWIDRYGHPHHISSVQSISETRLHGPWQPLFR